MYINGTGPDDQVHGQVADEIGTITLNRPDRRNALTEELVEGLASLVSAMSAAQDIGVIVLTGAGGAFCSGGDVQDFDAKGGEGAGSSEVDLEAVDRQRRQQEQIIAGIRRCPKPTIAAIPGAVAGAGLGIALAADFRIASERFVMATAFVSVGLSGDYGVAWLLNDLVGPAKARELMMLSPRVRAEEALALGIVNEVVPQDEFEGRTRELALQLVQGPWQALAGIKSNLVRAAEQTLEQNMHDEVLLHKATGLSDDHIGAARAFVEKRTPSFGTHRR